MPSAAQACAKCGKRAADHPSLAGRNVGDDFGEEVATGPALDLDLGAVPSARGASNQPLGRTVGADEWDDDAAPLAGVDLQLDGGPDERLSGRGAAAAPVSQRQMPTSQRQLAPQKEAPLAARRGETPAKSAVDIDVYEVKALADYGAEPKSIVQTVPYAVRVVLRQRELRRAMEGVRKALAEAEGKRDDRLVELGTLLRPIVQNSPEYAQVAAPLVAAEKIVRDREAALADTNATFRERAAAIDAEIAGLDPQQTQARAELEAKTRAFEDQDRLRQKHEARRKRVEIEVRAAQTKLDNPQTPPPERAQAQQVIAQAQQERATRAAEEKIAIDAAQQAEAQVATARRAAEAIEHKIEQLRARRRDLEKEFARQGAVRSEGVEAASKEVRSALLEIGRRAAHGGPEAQGAEVRRKAIVDAEAQVKRLQIDLEKHVRALAAADPTAVRNGLVILGAAIVLLLGAFIAWRALRSNPYLPGDQQPRSQLVRVAPTMES